MRYLYGLIFESFYIQFIYKYFTFFSILIFYREDNAAFAGEFRRVAVRGRDFGTDAILLYLNFGEREAFGHGEAGKKVGLLVHLEGELLERFQAVDGHGRQGDILGCGVARLVGYGEREDAGF